MWSPRRIDILTPDYSAGPHLQPIAIFPDYYGPRVFANAGSQLRTGPGSHPGHSGITPRARVQRPAAVPRRLLGARRHDHHHVVALRCAADPDDVARVLGRDQRGAPAPLSSLPGLPRAR